MYSPVDDRTTGLAAIDEPVEGLLDTDLRPTPPMTVLIVDEDSRARAALRAMLAPLGYRIVEATTGSDARRCVTQTEFAVILVDLRASSSDGFATAAFVRSREPSISTPILFITTSDRAEHELTEGYAMGAVDFILAPVVPAALRGKVSLFADLFTKTRDLVESARRLRVAATNSAAALSFQLEMLDRMEQLGRAKSEFVSRISHELRSPLTSVIGYVELLLDGGAGAPNEDQSRMLTIIERNSLRLLALIEDLLTMSRVESGTFELDVRPVDLGDLIERVRETTAPAVANAELDFVVELGGARQLMGDRDQLERALLNLVSNSVKFSSPGGLLTITTCTEADDVTVSVRDTGSGIPIDEQGQLFTRFFRSTRSKEQQVAGTGLGLYIVKQIIELHGGEIEVVSSHAGSTFTMRLPVAGPPADPLALVRRR